jgi:hypothetical protein
MNVYMLRDRFTGHWYVRGGVWQAKMEGAAIWTTIRGPNSAKGAITIKQHKYISKVGTISIVRSPEIVTLTIQERSNA